MKPKSTLKPNEVHSFGCVSKYNEPEGHIQELSKIIKNMGLPNNIIIRGLSPKDDSLLKELGTTDTPTTLMINKNATAIYYDAKRLDLKDDDVLTIPEKLKRIKPGTINLLIARHILEHTNNPRKFLQDLKRISSPRAIIILEVPDNKKNLEQKDYTMPWIEHTQYYTEETFKRALTINGFEIISFMNIPYPLENSLVAIVKTNEEIIAVNDVFRAANYSLQLEKTREQVKIRIRPYQLAILGAGHLTKTFIELMNIKDDVKMIIDDDPEKQGKTMLGIPIKKSELMEGINLCLIGANPMNEEKIITKLTLIHKNTIFKSIFPSSPRYMLKEAKK
jgi:hypothetical protein